MPPDTPDPDPSPDAAVGSDPDVWLILIYKVPTEPSRLRVSVWRRLKGLGAIYLQSSASALPAGASAERALRKLQHEIIQMAGSAVLLRTQRENAESAVQRCAEALERYAQRVYAEDPDLGSSSASPLDGIACSGLRLRRVVWGVSWPDPFCPSDAGLVVRHQDQRRCADSSERRWAEDLDRTGGLRGRTDPVEVDGRWVVLAGVPVERLACSRVLEGEHPGGG